MILQIADRSFNPARSLFKAVVKDNKGSFLTQPIGIGEDILIDRPGACSAK